MSVLRSVCPVCQKSENLLRCQGCLSITYCGREHQIADRNDHKLACNAVKNAKTNMEQEEQKLRAAPSDFMLPANVFENAVGRFWGIFATHDYMRARYGVVEKLLKIKTYDAVKAAFDHMKDMIRLCRGDNMGLRFQVPALFIRLGLDQECYDFMKWHVTAGQDPHYDWGNINLPFLNVRDADVSEPVTLFVAEFAHLEFAVALLLIKMRLLKDVQTLQNSLFIYDHANVPLPPELVDRIRKMAMTGNIASKRKDILTSSNQKPLLATLEQQIKLLFNFVYRNHKYFWLGLLDPANYLASRPTSYSAQLTLQYYYQAYVETDSIEVISKMVCDDLRSLYLVTS